MTHQSAYGLPLSGTDTEFMRFLELRKATEPKRRFRFRLRTIAEKVG